MSLRWFTAHRVAKHLGAGQWSFEPSTYLGVDDQGQIQRRCARRPADAQIIHDLGHALLAPPGILAFEQAPLALDKPGALQGFLLAQRQLGQVGLREQVDWSDDASLPKVLSLVQAAAEGRARRLTQASAELIGALEAQDFFDAAVWDLDAPQLASLPEQAACELALSGQAGPCVKQVWIAGELI